MKEKLIFGAIGVVWLFALSFWAAMIYVAFHFINKYW